MAIAADIPPELFNSILAYMCEDTRGLAMVPYQSPAVPSDVEIRKGLAACALTCVHWARTCRNALFRYIRIQGHQDLLVFKSLVAKTPKRFMPISDFIWVATLVQRVEDRPWLHTLQLQPSRFPCNPGAIIEFVIVDSPAEQTIMPNRITRTTLSRLFSSLPRTLPPSCLQCDYLTVQNPRFRSINDILTLLRKFKFRYVDVNGASRLALVNAVWESEIHDTHSDLLAREMLTPISQATVVSVVGSSTDLAEIGWLVYAAAAHNMQLSLSPSSSTRIVGLRLHPSVQRVILAIAKLSCQIQEHATFVIHSPRTGSVRAAGIRFQEICSISHDYAYSQAFGVHIGFYATLPRTEHFGNDGYATIGHISALRITVTGESHVDALAASPRQSCNLTTYPWEDIVGLFVGQESFLRLQLELPSHDSLVHLMNVQRPVLTRLNLRDRVGLYHRVESCLVPGKEVRAVDFDSLKDIGDAWSHEYLWY